MLSDEVRVMDEEAWQRVVEDLSAKDREIERLWKDWAEQVHIASERGLLLDAVNSQREAALALHQGVWRHDGFYCMVCHEGPVSYDLNLSPWPCPTAKALGSPHVRHPDDPHHVGDRRCP